MAKNTIDEGHKMGWNLTEEGVDLCKSLTNKQQPKTQDLLKLALNVDIANTSKKVIEDFQRNKNELNGPVVLQVVKVRNVSAPKENEESKHAPRMLQLTLTDGHKQCNAIEMQSIKSLSLNTEPGSKICLLGCIESRQSTLLLTENNVNVLGGRVENIYNKWMATKLASGYSRTANTGEAAPPFVPFGQKISTFKSSKSSIQPKETKLTENEFTEFDEQRTSAIAEIKKQKNFANDKSFTQHRNQGIQPTLNISSERNSRKGEFSTNQSFKNSQPSPSTFSPQDEKNCDQLVQMGFSFHDAKKVYQQCSNNLERAVDSLLSGRNGGGDNRQQRSDFGGGRRGRGADYGGGRGGRERVGEREEMGGGRRGGREGGGGRGQGRRGRDEEMEEGDRPSSNTLFDFLETKISSSKPKQAAVTNHSSSKLGGYNHKDELSQEESLIEYVKQLSLTENYGAYRGANEMPSFNKTKPSRQDKISQPSSQLGHMSSSGVGNVQDHFQPKSSRYDNNTEEWASNQKKHRENFQQKSTSKPETRKKYDHIAKNVKSSQNDRVNFKPHGGDREQRGKNDGRNSRNFQPTRDGQNVNYQDKKAHQNDQFHTRNRNFYRSSDSNYNNPQKHYTAEKQSNCDAEKTPRFQKPNDNQYRYSDRSPDKDNSYSGGNVNKKALTLAETGRKLKENLPSTESLPKNKTPTQNFYQPRNNRKDTQERNSNSEHHNNENQLNKSTVKWKKGMHCFATYWEDNVSYPAIIQDVHDKNQTAVVLFIQYGNCEEVVFQDLRLS